jgi:hypothetical protein
MKDEEIKDVEMKDENDQIQTPEWQNKNVEYTVEEVIKERTEQKKIEVPMV